MDHCLTHYQLLEAFHKVPFWVPSFSCCISMTFYLQYLIAKWIFTPMTLHYGWLILILCISNTDFREVSTTRITGSRQTRWFQMQRKQNSYLLEPRKNFPTAQTHHLTFTLRGIEIEEAVNEKLLGVKIDKHLNWNNRIDYIITKLNSRVNLFKRARKYLNLSYKNLLYNALIKSIFEYCCSVWGNNKIDNIQRLLRIKKRCARVILNAGIERTVGLFKRLGWIPISDIIEQRKLCIIHGKCPDYFNQYIRYVKYRIITQLGRQLIWTSPHLFLAL